MIAYLFFYLYSYANFFYVHQVIITDYENSHLSDCPQLQHPQ